MAILVSSVTSRSHLILRHSRVARQSDRYAGRGFRSIYFSARGVRRSGTLDSQGRDAERWRRVTLFERIVVLLIEIDHEDHLRGWSWPRDSLTLTSETISYFTPDHVL